MLQFQNRVFWQLYVNKNPCRSEHAEKSNFCSNVLRIANCFKTWHILKSVGWWLYSNKCVFSVRYKRMSIFPFYIFRSVCKERPYYKIQIIRSYLDFKYFIQQLCHMGNYLYSFRRFFQKENAHNIILFLKLCNVV